MAHHECCFRKHTPLVGVGGTSPARSAIVTGSEGILEDIACD